MLMTLGRGLGSTQQGASLSPWLPSDLSALLAWYDFSDAATLTISGTNISNINDKSGNAHHLSESTATNQPQTTMLNSLSAAEFTNDFLTLNDNPSGTALSGLDARDCCIAVVFNQVNSTNSGGMISLKSTAGGDFIMPNFGNTDDYYGPDDAGSSFHIEQSVFTRGITHLMVLNMDGTDITLYPNGGTGLNVGTPAASNYFNTFVIGRRVADAKVWTGTIGEVIVTSSALNTADRQDLEGYLAHKWGIASS